jgi:hypothetical protein
MVVVEVNEQRWNIDMFANVGVLRLATSTDQETKMRIVHMRAR